MNEELVQVLNYLLDTMQQMEIDAKKFQNQKKYKNANYNYGKAVAYADSIMVICRVYHLDETMIFNRVFTCVNKFF